VVWSLWVGGEWDPEQTVKVIRFKLLSHEVLDMKPICEKELFQLLRGKIGNTDPKARFGILKKKSGTLKKSWLYEEHLHYV
jgi:hypothetical protein